MVAKLFGNARLRGAALLLIGSCLVAAMVGPVSAGGPSPRADQSRIASCAGLDFYPLSSGVSYDSYLSRRIANGYVLCDPGLPHRAVVTKVQFTLFDDSTFDMVYCSLVRTGLTLAGALTTDWMASVGGTTGTPGLIRPGTSAISFATIDNARWGYYLQCAIQAVDPQLGLHGANVTYTISATNG